MEVKRQLSGVGSCHPLHFESGFLLFLPLHSLLQAVWPQHSQAICTSRLPSHCMGSGITDACCSSWLFTWVLGIQKQLIRLAWQVLLPTKPSLKPTPQCRVHTFRTYPWETSGKVTHCSLFFSSSSYAAQMSAILPVIRYFHYLRWRVFLCSSVWLWTCCDIWAGLEHAILLSQHPTS